MVLVTNWMEYFSEDIVKNYGVPLAGIMFMKKTGVPFQSTIEINHLMSRLNCNTFSSDCQFLAVNVLKFWTLVALTNMADPDQTASEEAVWSRSFLSAILTSIFVNFSHENQHFIWGKRSVWNFRTFIVLFFLRSVTYKIIYASDFPSSHDNFYTYDRDKL